MLKQAEVTLEQLYLSACRLWRYICVFMRTVHFQMSNYNWNVTEKSVFTGDFSFYACSLFMW